MEDRELQAAFTQLHRELAARGEPLHCLPGVECARPSDCAASGWMWMGTDTHAHFKHMETRDRISVPVLAEG